MARPLIWSAVGGIATFVFGALIAAFIKNEEPFNHNKTARDDSIAIARVYAIPIGGLSGAVAGLSIRTYVKRHAANRGR